MPSPRPIFAAALLLLSICPGNFAGAARAGGGQETPGTSQPGGGLRGPAATGGALGQVVLSPEGVGLAALACFVLLAGYHFAMRRYIRDAAGVKDVQKTEIVGQPVRMTAEVEFLPMHEFKDFERYVHEREHAIRDELQALRAAIDDRRQEGALQIDGLRDRIDAGVNEAIKASNSSASKIHGRMDSLAEKQGVMVGELRQISDTLRSLTTALQARALGGKNS